MAKAEFLTYTEKDLEAIAILKENAGKKLSAKELGIPNATLTSLIKKANNERPMANGMEKVIVNKEDCEVVCPECGAKRSFKLYWIDQLKVVSSK